MSRWVLTHVGTGATWTMPINPNTMSSPHQDRSIQTSYGTRAGTERLRGFVTPTEAKEWTFGGVIRTKEHYDTLEAWAKLSGHVRITDHLGRTFEVLISEFTPEDRRPSKNVAWRMTYQMKTLLLRRVA
jgi:hypothetical protein